TAVVARRLNPILRVSGIVVCLFEANTRLAQEVLKDLDAFLERGRGQNVPWAAARAFTTRIRRNIKLAECPSFGRSVFAYAPGCHGAADYAALAREVLGEQAEILSARVAVDEAGRVEAATPAPAPAL